MAFERTFPNRLPQNPFKHDPMLKYALLLCLGIVLGWTTKDWYLYLQWILLCIGLFLMIGTIVVYGVKRWDKQKGWHMVFLSAAAAIFVAAGWTQCIYHKVHVDNWPTEARVWIGDVVNIHKVKESYTTIDLRLRDENKSWNGKLVRVSFSKACLGEREKVNVRVGDEMFFHCRLSSSVAKVCPSDFNYSDYLVVHHISGTGYVGGKRHISVLGSQREQSTNNQSDNNQSINQSPTNQQRSNHQSANHQSANHQSINQSPTNQQRSNHQSANHQSTNHQSDNNQSINQHPTNQQRLNHLNSSIHPNSNHSQEILHPHRFGFIEGFRVKMLGMRESLLEEYARYFKDENLSVLSALTLGDKSLLEKDTQQVFSETGTSHILALSGLHLGILVSIFNFLVLKRLRRWWARALGLVSVVSLLWTFTFLVGLPISLLRASTMFTLMQIGVSMGRGRGATLNNLSLSAILLLVVDPLSFYDVGFQMSFTAVLAIILAERYVWRRFPLPMWHDGQFVLVKNLGRPVGRKKSDHIRHVVIPQLKNNCARGVYNTFRNVIYPFLCVSLSAQWGTMPLVLYYFHLFSPYTFLANFVVIPAAYALLSLALLFFVLPFGAVRVAIVAVIVWTLDTMLRFLQWMSSLSGSSFAVSLSWWILILIWLIPVMAYALFQIKKKRARMYTIMVATLSIVVGIVGQMVESVRAHITPRVLVYKVNGLPAVHLIQSSEKSYILSSLSADSVEQKLAYVSENYFAPHEIAHPQVLHTGGRCASPVLVQEGGLVVFRHKAILLLDHSLACVSRSASCSDSHRPKEVDLLVVAKGCRNSYAQVSRFVRPQRVVLSSNLPSQYRRQWRRACAEAHVACHDVQADGYYEWRL